MRNPFVRKAEKDESAAIQIIGPVDPHTFAWSINRLRMEKKPPFDPQTMRSATLGIPPEWHGLFEFAVEANQYTELFELLSSRRIGPKKAGHLLVVTGKYLQEISDAHGHIAALFATMYMCEPLSTDHPLFSSESYHPFVSQRQIFGRAKVAMQHIEMTDEDRLWATGELGLRLILATEVAHRCFVPLTESIQFVESEEDMVKAAQRSAR
jgi:hypothetical protein